MPDFPGRPRGSDVLPPDYAPLLADLKAQVRSAQLKAAVAVNRNLVQLYWGIGRRILDSQRAQGWGAKVVDRLAADLRSEAYPQDSIVQQAAGQLPWWHNVILLTKLKDQSLREWYSQKDLEHGWSRDILELQIESRLHEREGKAVTNFAQSLPLAQSDMAQQLLKDPYSFDFLTIAGKAKEKEIEKGLVDHVQEFLLELGYGFSFGLVLAREKSRMIVEYALRDMMKPIGVAEWQTRLVDSLPRELKNVLPTIEDLEAGLPPDDANEKEPRQ